MSMGSVLSSYMEQVQTTFETMRRRGLVLYDAGALYSLRADQMRKNVPKQFVEFSHNKEITKAYDDVFDKKPLDATNKSKRNNLQELYFGVSVLIVAMCAGEMTGVLWSASILSSIFDPIVEVALIFLLPVYAYLHLKQRVSYDAIERRSWLFGFVFLTCVPIGDLFGARLISTNPSLFFIPTFLLALLIDIEFSPESLYANRQRLLTAVLAGSFLLTQSLAVLCGMASFASFLVSLYQCALIGIHFQILEPRIENDDFDSEAAADIEAHPTNSGEIAPLWQLFVDVVHNSTFSKGHFG